MVPRIPVQPTGVATAAHIPVLPAVPVEPAVAVEPAKEAPAAGAPPAPIPAAAPPAPVPAVVLAPAPAAGVSSPSALEQLAEATQTRIDVTRSETPRRSFGIIAHGGSKLGFATQRFEMANRAEIPRDRSYVRIGHTVCGGFR